MSVGRLHYSRIHVLKHQVVCSFILFRNLDLIGNCTEKGMESVKTETPILTLQYNAMQRRQRSTAQLNTT